MDLSLRTYWHRADGEGESVTGSEVQFTPNEEVGGFTAAVVDVLVPGSIPTTVKAHGHSREGHFSVAVLQESELLTSVGTTIGSYFNQWMKIGDYHYFIHIEKRTKIG